VTIENTNRVVITDVKIPFMSMVTLMVKWVLASIPAFLILAILGGIVTAIFGGIFGGFFAGMGYH